MILIVDDQKEIGTGLQYMLRHAGHEATSVTSGEEALAMLQDCRPALLVLDVTMPKMDGLSVLGMIRADNKLQDLRVVMFSGDAHPQTVAEAKRLGALDFLEKATLELDKLVDRISELAAEPAQDL